MMFRSQQPVPVRPGDIALVHFGESYFRRILIYNVLQGQVLDGQVLTAQDGAIAPVRNVKVTDVAYVYPRTSLL